MADAISKQGLGILNALIAYFFTVVFGLLLQLCFYLLVVKLVGGFSPLHFLTQMREALILAFSTSSSSATLPVTMRLAEKGLGIPPKTTSFVLPLGATINMDGTALYQGVAVVFICQVYGHALGPLELLTIVIMATMASIGAAGVPGAGILTLVMVLDSVAPVLVAGIALILGVDRILDMCRTTVNVCGDCAACIVMNLFNRESSEPKP
jgi:Na+/H+-dicarboxylate symporter